MIRELLEQGATRAEIVAICVEQLGMSEIETEEMIAIELGEAAGDLFVIDENGKRRPLPPPPSAADMPGEER